MVILKAPNPILRKKTKPVKKITPELLKIAGEMIKFTQTFTDPEGVGLSANQIGREESFFIAKLFQKFNIFINPKVVTTSKSEKVFFEGCLSIPDYYGYVRRPTIVTVQYQDETGKTQTKQLRGTAAWIFQHEADHLNGILFMDHVLQQGGKVFKVVGKDQTGAEVFEEVKLI